MNMNAPPTHSTSRALVPQFQPGSSRSAQWNALGHSHGRPKLWAAMRSGVGNRRAVFCTVLSALSSRQLITPIVRSDSIFS